MICLKFSAAGEVYQAGFSSNGLTSLCWLGKADSGSLDDLPPREGDWVFLLKRELDEYFAGSRRKFSVPVDLSCGTGFQREVWQGIASIPYGQWLSYGELASRLGRPKAVRAVGSACGANPVPLLIPCHRVLASGGRIGGFGSGLDRKRSLLSLEGIAWLE